MKSLGVAARLMASFAAVVAVFLVVLGGSGWVAFKVMQASEEMERDATLLSLAEQWVAHIRQNSARSLAVAQSNGPDMLNFFGDAMKATTAATSETQKAFLALATADDKALAEEVVAARKDWLAARDEVNRLKQAGEDAGARALVAARFQPATVHYIEVAEGMARAQKRSVKERLAEIQERFHALFAFGAAFAAMGLVVAAVVAVQMVRSIRRGLHEAMQGAVRLGEGDLSRPIAVHRHDEFGQLQAALNEAQAALRTLVQAVRESADSIHLSSSEVATGNLDLSARTEQAASSLQTTAASMEQVSSAVQLSADGSQQAMALVNQTAVNAHSGGQQVSDVVATMQEIQESSQRIADITGVIDGIAFQTNILALNAAVEAARAGEQGRGFAVVAGEVRALASRSADAAREIKSLIGRNVERVERGADLVARSGNSMRAIVTGVTQVRGLIEGITQSTAEQSQGVLLINQAMADIDSKTQQNAALVEQSAAAAASLQRQAERLKGLIEQFRLT